MFIYKQTVLDVSLLYGVDIMGFLDFLKKKPSAPVGASTIAASSSTSAPQAPRAMPSQFELPELPSFDGAPANFQTPMGSATMDLPPLPSFDEHANFNAPAGFGASMSAPQSFDASALQPPAFPDFNQQTSRTAATTVQNVSAPPMMSAQSDAYDSGADSASLTMQSIDAHTPFGPVYCDVETYRTILANLNYAKDEIAQLQTFSENSKQLHTRSQAQFDAFHNSLSTMARKMLMAEAKLFRQ